MKLVHNEIPVDFLRSIPEGMKLVNRHGREFLVVEELKSPGGTSLISDAVRIHGQPSIRFKATIGDVSGLIFIDAFWGSHAKLFGFLPAVGDGDQYVEARVPETDESLMIQRNCDVEGCTSDRGIEFLLPGAKNRIHVCARLGCPGHQIVLSELGEPVAETVSGINFFGAGSLDDDWFESV